jgi:hypothetical protein
MTSQKVVKADDTVKSFRYKAPDIPRSEAYMLVRRNDEV